MPMIIGRNNLKLQTSAPTFASKKKRRRRSSFDQKGRGCLPESSHSRARIEILLDRNEGSY